MSPKKCLLLLILLPFLSCKKNSGSTGASSCRLMMTQASNGVSYVYTYDAQGRMASEKYTSGGTSLIRTFVYGTNLELITNTDQNNKTSVDTVRLNANGYVLSDSNVVQHVFTSYTYGAGNQLMSMLQFSRDSADGIATVVSGTNYVYNDTQLSSDDQGNSYVFDTVHAAKPGDYLQLGDFQQFGNGGHTFNNAFMLRSIRNSFNRDTLNYAYNYDKSGNVSAILITGVSSGEIDLSYDCQ